MMGKALSGELSCPCDRSCSIGPLSKLYLVESVQMRGYNVYFLCRSIINNPCLFPSTSSYLQLCNIITDPCLTDESH